MDVKVQQHYVDKSTKEKVFVEGVGLVHIRAIDENDDTVVIPKSYFQENFVPQKEKPTDGNQ